VPPPPEAQPATGRSAAERAYQHVKTLVLSGALSGGSVISEVTLSRELAVSRTPVHEAFLRLAVEGLLTLESRKGAVVVPASPREADDVIDMRLAIESACIRRVVDDGRAEQLADALGLILEEQRSRLSTGDTYGYLNADRDFHTTVILAAANPLATQFAQTLADRVGRLRAQIFRIKPETVAQTLSEHEDLLAAVAAEDSARYADVLSRHVERLRGVW
jgi:DNA-binding GntR family transcriptional regulator